jgi:hypothetical protein
MQEYLPYLLKLQTVTRKTSEDDPQHWSMALLRGEGVEMMDYFFESVTGMFHLAVISDRRHTWQLHTSQQED